MKNPIISENSKRRRLIAVIGDAKVELGSNKDLLAEEIGCLLIDAGFRLLTGGLSGVMESASRGARNSKSYREGDIVGVLPGHNPTEANSYVDIVIATGLDHLRNSIVVHSDAVIAIGGGAGTLSELSLAWIYKRLIVALRVDGWSGKLSDTKIDHRQRYPTIPEDRVYGADTAIEVLAHIQDKLSIYHSSYEGINRGL